MKRILLLLPTLLFGMTLIAQDAEETAGAATISITEFNYNSDKFNNPSNWVELHNYGGAAVSVAGWQIKDATGALSYTIPAATTLDADEYLVVAEWLDTFQMVFPAVTNAIGSMGFGFGNMSGTIRLLDNSGSLIKQINYLDSVPWPKGSDGFGPTVQILDEMGAESDGNNWIAGCVLGTPGAAYVPCDYDIVVNEINYNSLPAYNPGDWIELYNRGSGTAAIGGWTLRDARNANAFVIPPGTNLAPGDRLVITDSLESFNVLFADVTNVIGEPTFNFSNGGDAIRLYASGDKIKYSVRYKDSSPWPLDPDGTGFTLELVDEAGNPNVPASWIAGCLYGSPGTQFIFPCPNAIQTFNPGAITIAPVPFTDNVVIELSNNNVMRGVRVYNLQGQLVYTATPNATYLQWDGKDSNGNTLGAGTYMVQITNDAGALAAVSVVKL